MLSCPNQAGRSRAETYPPLLAEPPPPACQRSVLSAPAPARVLALGGGPTAEVRQRPRAAQPVPQSGLYGGAGSGGAVVGNVPWRSAAAIRASTAASSDHVAAAFSAPGVVRAAPSVDPTLSAAVLVAAFVVMLLNPGRG